MVTCKDNDLTLHSRFKQADMILRDAIDDLESARFHYQRDPSDANRKEIKKAKARVRQTAKERADILEDIAAEVENLDSAW